MSDLVLRLARPGEDARIADFINQNFDMRLPLINRADFYQFYYCLLYTSPARRCV